jgi:hypothetical protein
LLSFEFIDDAGAAGNRLASKPSRHQRSDGDCVLR